MALKNFPGYQSVDTSIIRTVAEEPIKKKFNWDRLFFLILLSFLLAWGGFKLYKKFAVIVVNGQVILEKMEVNFTDDIRIKNLKVNEGDEVQAGDTLFSYLIEKTDDNLYVDNYNKYDGNNWFLRERLSLSRQINAKASEIKGMSTLLELKKSDLDLLKQQIYLGANLSHKLTPLLEDINELENDIEGLRAAKKVLEKHLRLIRYQERKAQEAEQQRIANEIAALQSFSKVRLRYNTPIAGIIGQIQKQPNEVCYEGETVMTIHQLGQIRLKAYFDPEYADNLTAKDEVRVVFPDGTVSQGYIQNFYVSTYPLPPEFQKKYEPVTRTIVADIFPVDQTEAKRWIGYYKMGVKIEKPRFKF